MGPELGDQFESLLLRLRAAHARYGPALIGSVETALDMYEAATPLKVRPYPTAHEVAAIISAVAEAVQYMQNGQYSQAQFSTILNQSKETLDNLGSLAPDSRLRDAPGAVAMEEESILENAPEPATADGLQNKSLAGYLIHQKLGEGNTTIAYLASDQHSFFPNRFVVLKVFRNPRQNDPEWRHRHFEVVESWIKSQDPAIIRLEDLRYSEFDKLAFYVTEHVDGSSLLRLFQNMDHLARVAAIPRLLRAICKNLTRDYLSLKETSILVGTDGLKIPLSVDAQDAVRQLGTMLARLLGAGSDTLPPGQRWLGQLIELCSSEPSPSIHVIQNFIRFHTEPRAADHIRLIAKHAHGIDYDLDINGQHGSGRMRADINQATLDNLAELWDSLGSLILKRLSYIGNGVNPATVHEEISTLVKVVSQSTRQVFPKEILDAIKTHSLSTLTLYHDRELNAIPWEAFQIDGQPLGIRFALTRMPRLQNPPRSPSRDQATRVVLVFNPRSSVCVNEADELDRVFLAQGFEVKRISTEDGPAIIRSQLSDCDILHIAGHGRISGSSGDISDSGLYLQGGDVLRAIELDALWREAPPLLVFANACFLAKADLIAARSRLSPDVTVGFAQAALAAGVSNFVGTALAAPEDPQTLAFATSFYEHWLGGRAISQAMREARLDSLRSSPNDMTYARYILFGDPFTTIEAPRAKAHRAAGGTF